MNSNNVIQYQFNYTKHPRRKNPVPDNLMNYDAAMELVKKILKYHHSRGRKQVKVWLEKEYMESGRCYYNVRSNVVYKVPQA